MREWLGSLKWVLCVLTPVLVLACDNSITGTLDSESSNFPFEFVDIGSGPRSSLLMSNIVGLSSLSEPSPVEFAGRGGASFDLSQGRIVDDNSFSFGPNVGEGRGFAFSPDGLRLFLTDTGLDQIVQYTLAEPYNLSQVDTTSVTFSVASQDDDPYEVKFNSDGTRMFVLGRQNTRVYQYNLSTGFDLSTAVYSTLSFNVNGPSSNPLSMAFNTAGSKMYILDSNATAYEYDVTVPFDLGVVAYSGNSASGLGEFYSQVFNFSFNNDGSQLYVVSRPRTSVSVYNLGTPFDLSTVSFANIQRGVERDLPFVSGMEFSGDGSAMFLSSTRSILKYSLSPAFFVLSADWRPATLPVTLLNGSYVGGMAISPDGLFLYVAGNNGFVYQWNLSTAFDLDSASYGGAVDVSSETTNVSGIEIDPSGSGLFVQGDDSDEIYQYSLSNPFQVTSASYDTVSLLVSGQDTDVESFTFSDDGMRLFMVGGSTPVIYQYSLTVAFDLSTATYDTVTLNVGAQEGNPRDIDFSPDGTKMFLQGAGTGYRPVYQYSLSTPFSVNTASYDNKQMYFTHQDDFPRGLELDPSGTRLFGLGAENSTVFSFTLGTAFDLSTATYDAVPFSAGGQVPFIRSMTVADDGRKMFILSEEIVYQYSLAEPFDVTTASYDSVSFDATAQSPSFLALNFSPDGRTFHLVANPGTVIHQYNCSTPFDLTTASYSAVSFSANGQDTLSYSVNFSPDGLKMFMVGLATDAVYQYSLTTPFDVGTASYDSVSYAFSNSKVSIAFDSTGEQMFSVSNDGLVESFSLGTAYDISSVTPGIHFFAMSSLVSFSSLTFDARGDRIYAYKHDFVFQFDIGDGGAPSYRTCSDPQCQTVVADWRTTSDVLVYPDQFIQFRLTSGSRSGSTSFVDVQVGNLSDEWQVNPE